MERFSFSGKGNILIKAAVAGKYGNEVYEANEPIAYFTNTQINLNFAYLEKVPRVAIDNLAVAPKSSASYLTVSNIKITDSLQSLLYKKQSNKKKNHTLVKKIDSEGGVLYLPLVSGEQLVGNLFVYNSNKEKETGYTVDTDNNTINGLSDGTYTVFYSIDKASAATFFLEAPTLPNIAAEIEVDGNLNGVTGKAVIHLNKLALLTRPSLDFTTENPFVDVLEFAVLNDKEAEVNYYGL